MAAGDRFYLLEFKHRHAFWGDVGSNLRINGICVGGADVSALLLLPTLRDDYLKHNIVVLEPTVQEWSDFIQYSDDPQIYVQEGQGKVFHRKMRYAISGEIQQKIWAADNFACVYCGAKMGQTLMTVDHFIPLEQGGKNDHTNFLTACRRCNKKKGSGDPLVFLSQVHRWLGNPAEKFEAIKKYIVDRNKAMFPDVALEKGKVEHGRIGSE